MSELLQLPNMSKKLEEYLILAGIETPGKFYEIGAMEAFRRIHVQRCGCGVNLRLLYEIQGAILGIPDKLLPDKTKRALKAFYKKLRE
jgi:DNA transformation protein